MANRRLAGKNAKGWGSVFEQAFRVRCQQCQVATTRIPDSCRQVTAQKMIRVRSPYDWVATFDGRTIFLDTKTCMGDAFAHSAIDSHQVEELYKHENQGATAGYLIWLRKIDSVIFASAGLLTHIQTTRGSIGPQSDSVKPLGNHRDFEVKELFQPEFFAIYSYSPPPPFSMPLGGGPRI